MESTTPQLTKPVNLSPQVRSSRPAGFFSRFEAFIIDLVILSIIQLVGAVFIEEFLRFFKFNQLVDSIKKFFENPTNAITAGSIVLTVIVISYFTFFWTLVGFTPGKAVLGLKVVRKDGAKISFGRALLRFFCYWISAIPLFLGFLWVLWDPKRRGWHDKIAGTQVLYIPKNPFR
jgi:uncharacterized RDD family membrane protein YckC